MARVLVVYSSSEGQTERIANALAARLRGAEHAVEVRRAESDPSPARYDGIVVGAPVRFAQHDRTVSDWVRRHRRELDGKPTAFFSVSMSAVSLDETKRAEARGIVARFLTGTEWDPACVELFGGRLAYRSYNPLLRFVMRRIAASGGFATDTSRDHEYTDWTRVTALADDFARRLEGRTASWMMGGPRLVDTHPEAH